jgi:hypothetical protein
MLVLAVLASLSTQALFLIHRQPYGFSDIRIWRTLEEPKKDHSHQKKLLPIEEKESYKWIESSLKTKKVLEKASEIIIIQDREGDIYEQFCLVPKGPIC